MCIRDSQWPTTAVEVKTESYHDVPKCKDFFSIGTTSELYLYYVPKYEDSFSYEVFKLWCTARPDMLEEAYLLLIAVCKVTGRRSLSLGPQRL